ncbi:MAG: PIN domain-containing protein [Cyanobacteria bacterium J06623_4]
MRRRPVYVFDTNIFVAALRSRRGASFVILNAIRQELISGAASQALLLEYADVLLREDNIERVSPRNTGLAARRS